MAKDAEEIWVCAECRSINRSRAKQCYNCRTPQHLAAVDPEMVSATQSGPVREIELPPYKGSRGRAVLASVCVLAIAAMQIASVVLVSDLIVGFFAGNEITEADVRLVNNLALASLGAALFALVTWSAWLSRVVAGIPALGLGYPAATGFTAFFENFIPVKNLFSVPAIVRDVIGRLEEHPARGNALIAGAWLGIFGGFIVPRVGAFARRHRGGLAGDGDPQPADPRRDLDRSHGRRGMPPRLADLVGRGPDHATSSHAGAAGGSRPADPAAADAPADPGGRHSRPDDDLGRGRRHGRGGPGPPRGAVTREGRPRPR